MMNAYADGFLGLGSDQNQSWSKAALADMRFAGSKTKSFSNKSRACAGALIVRVTHYITTYLANTSFSLRLLNVLGDIFCHSGSLKASGHVSFVGVPQSSKVTAN